MENQQSPWFEGSVGDAVAKATNEKLLFLSFIYDDDENSTKMRELLSDSEISTLMKSKSVAIEMKKGSETFNLFSQIFPTFFCPCLAFIQNGKLIYFLNSEATKDTVLENINKYADMKQDDAAAPTNTTQAPAQAPTQATTKPKSNSSTPPQASSPKDADAEKKKAERITELKKLKQDNNARRKQILEQINNDRKERESRNNSYSSGGGSKANSSESLQKLMSEKPKSNISSGSEALISVRYLDGSLLRQEFKRNQKLSEIRKWIDDTTKAKGIFKPYNLETKYPEHQFTFGEETKTLMDLNLDDTDLLICKPVTKVFSANPKQALDLGKYFTSNFFKDILLFFYAFLLSLNIFRDPTKPIEEGAGEQGGNGTTSFNKGKIRMNNDKKKFGTLDDIRGDNKKPQETYNGNSTNQQ